MNIGTIGGLCTGCGLCAAVCPTGAVSMAADAEGFRVPKVDMGHCTDCGLCLKRCPVNNPIDGFRPLEAFAARSKDDGTLLDSSSGGLFTELSRSTLSKGGCVYGAVMGTDGEVRIERAENYNEL